MRRFTINLAVAGLAIAGGYQAARMLAPTQRLGGAATTSASVAGANAASAAGAAHDSGDGDRLMASVLSTLDQRMNIYVKVRQAVRARDADLTGEGEYWQEGRGNTRRTCWQLKTVVAGETALFNQVYDGDFLWTDRRLPPASRTITRIDVESVRRQLAMAEDLPDRSAAGIAKQELLVRGGLTQLFAELGRCFTFSAPQPVRHGQQTALAVVGRWRDAQLLREWPSLTSESAAWPAHLPHHVLVQVDSNSYFPYLVEYRGVDQAELAASAAAPFAARQPLARYEFINVQFTAAMPDHLFQFAPAQLDWQDATSRTLERLRPPPAPAGNDDVARRYGTWRL